MGNQARVVSAAFAFSGFAVAVASGMIAGGSAERVLMQAVLAMLACQCVGSITGGIAARVIEDHKVRYEKLHPVPEIPNSRRDGVVIVDEEPESSRAAA
jgi:hypothetical protein